MLTATITRNEALENPVTPEKFKNLVDKATISVGGTAATANIANLAVTAAKLAAGAVETAKIADLAVTAAKIAAGTITPYNMSLETRHMYFSVGEVRQYCASSIPPGFVLCDGATRNIDTYPKVAENNVFMPYTSATDQSFARFTVPDLRGKFIRVATANTDIARNVGESYPSTAHSHSLLAAVAQSAGANGGTTVYPIIGASTVTSSDVIGGTKGPTGATYTAATRGGQALVSTEGLGGGEVAPAHTFLIYAVYIGLDVGGN